MRLRLISWPSVMFMALVLAAWPVWRWYVLRTIDGSDEPCGLLALATLVVVASRTGVQVPRAANRWIVAAVLLVVYLMIFAKLSPLPRALVMAAVFAVLCFPKRHALSLTGLLCLSLPVVATVQFYLGYPLRILAGGASVAALRALGLAVVQEGALLEWRGETIMIDAPCSGVRMLWFGLYLAGCVAAWNRLDNCRTLLVFAVALPLVIGANILRATALFLKETRIIALPDWTHAAIGVVIFGAAALVIVHLARKQEMNSCTA